MSLYCKPLPVQQGEYKINMVYLGKNIKTWNQFQLAYKLKENTGPLKAKTDCNARHFTYSISGLQSIKILWFTDLNLVKSRSLFSICYIICT